MFAGLVIVCMSLGGVACGDDDTGSNADGGGDIDGTVPDDGTVSDGDAAVTNDASPTGDCVVTRCAGHLLQCGDCVDNDGDGQTDSWDRECLGPCDNTEGPELYADVGGEPGGPCLADCYFDFGNGSGNDDCYWNHRCDPLAVAPDYPPEGVDCEYNPALVDGSTCPASQSTQCLDYCLPITPNGCDCFGCCTFPDLAGLGPGGGPGYVWIGRLDADNVGTCTFDLLLDASACPPCTPVLDCINECGECEICIGMTEADLPAWCNPEDRCPDNVQACGLPDDPPCPEGYYCVTGCCLPPVN